MNRQPNNCAGQCEVYGRAIWGAPLSRSCRDESRFIRFIQH
ncbi:MAG: hypothetical protein O4804_10595 [Trichodesmium sp. St11_bin5]|nr:hypothetical protein [Trichodesmium sp. St11_bin5]